MFDYPVLCSNTVLLPSSSDQAIKLICQKLPSTEAAASKLSTLLADGDSLMTHTDSDSSNESTVQSGDTGRTFKTLSPVLAKIPVANTSHDVLVLRLCRVKSAVSLFRATVTRISRERDYWKQEKLSSDERCSREADALRMEIARLRKESESNCRSVTEAKEKMEKTNEQLRSDLLQSVTSFVCVSPM